jgi:putative salt-induced outer membrane protein YdiY
MKALAVAAALLLPLTALAEDPAPPPEKKVDPAPPPEKKVQWKGTAGAGLIILTGNSDTTTFTGSAEASRETFGWILSAKATGAYGENRPSGGALQVTAFSAAGQVRLDRKFGEVWTVFVLGGLETDRVASVEYRTIAELGVSAQWIEVKVEDWQRLALRSDLGFRYGYEARHQYYGTPVGPQPGVELLAPRLGLAFRYGFSKEVFFTEDAEVFPSLTGESRVQLKSVSKLSSHLTKAITLGVGYTVAFDSGPAAGKEKTDTGLTALLEVGF